MTRPGSGLGRVCKLLPCRKEPAFVQSWSPLSGSSARHAARLARESPACPLPGSSLQTRPSGANGALTLLASMLRESPALPRASHHRKWCMSVKFLLSVSIIRSATLAMGLLALTGTAIPGRADVVTDWNVIALQTIPAMIMGPPQARLMGYVQAAVFDA